MKKCPYCAENIQDEAVICRYCGRNLQPRKSALSLIVIIVIIGFLVTIICGIVLLVTMPGDPILKLAEQYFKATSTVFVIQDPSYLRPSSTVFTTQDPTNRKPTMINSRSEFEASWFCQQYGCRYMGSNEILEGIDSLYIVRNYPNKYDDILIELINNGEEITKFGLVLDGMPPERPHLSKEDLDFVYNYLASIAQTSVIDTKIIEFINQNIEVDINQICQGKSIEFYSMRLWVGKVREPTISVRTDCPTPLTNSRTTPLIPTTPLPSGSILQVENWEVQVERIEIVQSLVGISGNMEKAAGRFALIFMVVTNRGLSTDTFVAYGILDVKDASGRRSEENFVASAYAEYQYKTDLKGMINPDETIHIVAVYDISTQSNYYILVPGLLADSSAQGIILEIP